MITMSSQILFAPEKPTAFMKMRKQRIGAAQRAAMAEPQAGYARPGVMLFSLGGEGPAEEGAEAVDKTKLQ